MGTLIIVAQFVLSLSILIVLHELGHFLPAKWFKTRVEKFYLFFDPWFSLFKYKKGETEYGIGWLPLGGYVKISGMVDESMDKEQMKQEPQPWEFRSKPAWQRLIIMLGGVTVNFLLGFFIFGMLLFVYGRDYITASNLTHGIAINDSICYKMGLQNGDKLMRIGEHEFTEFNSGQAVRQIILFNANTLTVERQGETKTLNLPANITEQLTKSRSKTPLFDPRMPFVVAQTVKGKPAEKAGFLANDSLIAVNNDTMQFFDQFVYALSQHKNKTVAITVMRNDSAKVLNVAVDENGKIGLAPYGPMRYFKIDNQSYSFFPAMVAGVKKGYERITDQISAFGQMFKGKIKAQDSLGGFMSIASLYKPVWDWQEFWSMTAFLSIILGFMNLLPIPALDGGHVVFLLGELITGRKPSDKLLEYAQMVGMVLLLSLLLFANGLDIYRYFFQ